jgi:maltooligosyltrehalose trehalohydrolase
MSAAQPTWILPIGAQPSGEETRFRVWAPDRHTVEVVINRDGLARATFPLTREQDGYFSGVVKGALTGDRYWYRLDGAAMFPDPTSRYQPEGVHGPSQIVDPSAFVWTDQGWNGVPLADLNVYEIHVGTATPQGTFDSLIAKLPEIRALGVTAIQLMAVADFPGRHNWGYDGVNWFAPSRNYGGPEALRRLVDAAHAHQLAVILDVVYNHLGPDGNYLSQFSRSYFTDEYDTPWGQAINYSRASGGPVRAMVVANACHWAAEYHVDGLRFDSIQSIKSPESPHILEEVATAVRAVLSPLRSFLLIPEDDSNDPKWVRSREAHGLGLDAVYADDFHHQVHVAVTQERSGYYADFSGTAQEIAFTLNRRWWLLGQTSQWHRDQAGNPRQVGAAADDVSSEHFLYCIQNHDQVGNRPLGERLNHLVAPAVYRAVSALLLLAPYTPLIFMGQEWAASSPFLFFTDHHAELGHLVDEGRFRDLRRVFPTFDRARAPRPQDPNTFQNSKLRWEERAAPYHASMLKLYTDLLTLRRTHPALRSGSPFVAEAIGEHAIVLRRQGPKPQDTVVAIANLSGPFALDLDQHPLTRGQAGHAWKLLLDSEATCYGGDGKIRLEEQPFLLRCQGPGTVALTPR